MSKDKTARKRQLDLKNRNDKRGLVQAKVWVPKHRRDELVALIAQWRAEHKLEGVS